MSNPYKSPEFKKLRSTWYEKLKQEGFKDAEHTANHSENSELKQWDSCYFQLRHEPEIFMLRQEYYLYAFQFLNAHSFQNPTRKRIWALYAEGKGARDITKQMKADKQQHTEEGSINKDKVALILRELRALFFAFLEEPR